MDAFRCAALVCALFVVSCGGDAQPAAGEGDQAVAEAPMPVGYGPNPVLPAPTTSALPTINVPEAAGWPENAAPRAAAGFTVTRYAGGLDHPRWLHVLPNGDVLVAEATSTPARVGGPQSLVRNILARRAGALGVSADRITLLRDADGDGDVDSRNVFLDGLNQPFGMALVGEAFYVGNTDAVARFDYSVGATRIEGDGEIVVRLPYRARDNGHWTRDLIASRDGTKLYVTVGSASNLGDHGMAAEEGRATIWEVDLTSGAHRIFASGLRNANGLAWQPDTGALWVAVNERDMLGDDLVPDYMTSVRDGAFYGWPYSYFGQNVDARVRPQRPELVARAIAPDYALGAHTASLGLVFCTSELFPARYRGGVFVGQHGSWNRSQLAGYKVIFVRFADGRPVGPPEDFLTGFISAEGRAQGRPVGVAFDRTGALLVADDVGDTIWRVAPSAR